MENPAVTDMEKGKPLLIIIIAVGLLAALSLVPWSRLTGGLVKDFNLIGDLVSSASGNETVSGAEFIDPELELAMRELEAEESDVVDNGADATAASASESDSALYADELPVVDASEIAPEYDPRVDGRVVIEDFTGDDGLSRIRKALASGRARIAVIGDSYIEGDILTQDFRDRLQQKYGGRGVGYVPAKSMVQSFRQTVRHTSEGLEQHPIQQTARSPYFALMGDYSSAEGNATITYKGNSKNSRLASWSRSRLMFVAPVDGTVTLTNAVGSQTFDVKGAQDSLQVISLPGETSSLTISTEIPGIAILGAWLDDGAGVTVDCMSMRGYSGVMHRNLNGALTAALRNHVDYDLIIMEFGINALSSEQSDYSSYSTLMSRTAKRLRQCYPNADILMLGIGDRGQKIHGEMHSVPTATNLIAAQRKAARDAGVTFWDTRAAMGGHDAVVDWRERGLVNADYIHLNSAGGRAIAGMLLESLNF